MSLCYHCGLDCGKHPVMWMDKTFCCDGCALVFRILHENRLDAYYQMESAPGIRVDHEALSSRYAFLDQHEFTVPFLEFSDGGISRTTLFIPVIHCSSCIWLLENLATLHKGVLQSSVNFVTKEVSMTFRESEITFRQLVELLHSIHYIPELVLNSKQGDKKQLQNRKLLAKIGISGFAFGNIMLLSFPDYLSVNELIDVSMNKVFSWVAFALAIPVLFFCANDYFISAYKSIRKGILIIDFPLSIGIVALFLQSSVEIILGNGIGYMDSFAGLIFFLLIGKWHQSKSYQALSFERDYKSYFPIAVTRITTTGEEFVPLKDLCEGDHILVRNHELVPADALIIDGQGQIDYSFVTGESIPVQKQIGDLVYAGGRQEGSGIVLRIRKEVKQSYLTQLWNTSAESKPLQKVVNKLSRYFTFGVLAIAALTAIYWIIVDYHKAVYVFSSILIVACPCALALSIPFTFGNTLRLFGRVGFYLKNADVVETLSKVDTIVFDKTGTITYAQKMNMEWDGKPLSDDEKVLIYSLSRNSTHPLSVLVSDFVKSSRFLPVDEYQEISGEGISGNVNSDFIKLGSKQFVTNQQTNERATQTSIYLSFNNVFRGKINVRNSYRTGLNEVLKNLSNHKLHLLSGDNDSEYQNLIKNFPDSQNLHFNQSPIDKRNYIQTLVEKKQTVAMIGDGLNDAGALQQANVGITIADDVYHFSPACDAILEATQFKQLHRFMRFSKTALKIVYVSFAISILYNLVGLYFAVQGQLSPLVAAILMPISSVSVVLFTTLAVRLGFRQIFR